MACHRCVFRRMVTFLAYLIFGSNLRVQPRDAKRYYNVFSYNVSSDIAVAISSFHTRPCVSELRNDVLFATSDN